LAIKFYCSLLSCRKSYGSIRVLESATYQCSHPVIVVVYPWPMKRLWPTRTIVRNKSQP